VENQQPVETVLSPAPAQPADAGIITFQRTSLNLIITAAVFLVIGMIIGAIAYERTSAAANEDLIRRVANTVIEANRSQMQSMITAAVSGETAVDPNRVYAVTTDGPTLGAEDALVTIVAFEDFQCSFCKRFRDTTLPQIMTNYGDRVRFVFRDFPILGQPSVDSALAGACANDQDKFWEFHDYFYGDQTLLTRDNFIAYAAEVGMDVEIFTMCYDTRQHEPTIISDLTEGQQLGVSGTPTFFINGKILIGARPYTDFVAMIETALVDAQTSDSAS